CRACGRASANELPDPHFEFKEFAFRVAASSANLPLEEPLLWRALKSDGDPNSSIRSAPVQESHAALPSSRIRGSKYFAPGGGQLLAYRSAGWLVEIVRRQGKSSAL